MSKVWIAGLGPGDLSMSVGAVGQLAARCDVFAGGTRLVDAIAPEGARRIEEISPSKIREALDAMEFEEACIVCSGDTGFYSLATSTLHALDGSGYEVEVLPGIATVQMMAARLGRPWQACTLRSARGSGGAR